MAKSLKDILAGVKSSKTVPGSTGTQPGVDYDPKAPAEQDFVAKHKTEKHADRVGNSDDVYKGKTKEAKYPKQDAKVYEETEASDDEEDEPVAEATCNQTEEGVTCGVHGEAACPDAAKPKGKKLKLILGGKKDCDCQKEEVEKKKDPKDEKLKNTQKEHAAAIGKAGELAMKLHKMKYEAVEELDEISKKTLEGYKKKNLETRLTRHKEGHKAHALAKALGKEAKAGNVPYPVAQNASDHALHVDKKNEKHDAYLVKAGEKIEAKSKKKKVAEEVEYISEIGDTKKGREALKKYMQKNLSSRGELAKKKKEASDTAHTAGVEAKRERAWIKTGHTTKEKHDAAQEKSEKTGKKKEHLRKKVVHRDEGLNKAQQRIDSKGKNVKKVLSSKATVDTHGKVSTASRRPGLEDKTHGETMHIKPKKKASKRFRMHIPDSATKPQEKKSGIKLRMKIAEHIIERHMTAAEKQKETAIKKKVDPSGMKASMKAQYGAEKGKQVYFATIRKKAMDESLAFPMLEGGKKKKKDVKETTGPDTPIRYPSGNVGKDRDTGYSI